MKQFIRFKDVDGNIFELIPTKVINDYSDDGLVSEFVKDEIVAYAKLNRINIATQNAEVVHNCFIELNQDN